MIHRAPSTPASARKHILTSPSSSQPHITSRPSLQPQVFIFSFTAFISLTNFFLYLRMSSDARARMDVWAYFGTFR